MITMDLTGCKRIGIAGAHGVGKTTLSKKLADITGLPLIPEFAKELLQVTKFEWDKEDRVWHIELFHEAIMRNYAFCLKVMDSGFISDRTIYDVLAYCLYQDIRLQARSDLFYNIATVAENILAELDKDNLYDKVLLYKLPDTVPNTGDGITQYFIESAIHQMLDAYNVPYWVIKRGDLIKWEDREIKV